MQIVAEPYPGRQPWLPLGSLFTGAGWRELGNRVRFCFIRCIKQLGY